MALQDLAESANQVVELFEGFIGNPDIPTFIPLVYDLNFEP